MSDIVLKSLVLTNFRSHRQYALEALSAVTIVVGANAAGKTSLIEALFLLATGSSFRASKLEEMITFDQEIGRVKAQLESEGETDVIDCLLTRGVVQGQRSPRTIYSRNGVKKRKKDIVGQLAVVAFRPEDLRLIEGSPSRRRQFVDTVLSLLFPDYQAAAQAYEATLKRLNKLLPAVREHEMPATVLSYWLTGVVKHGQVLQTRRQAFFQWCQQVEFPLEFEVKYQPSPISAERIREYQARSIAAGHLLVGPHKDDFAVWLTQPAQAARPDPLLISAYGSRGQQRLAVLWLKMCELQYVTQIRQSRPMLLLDDIFSELDYDHQQLVIQLLKSGQNLVTTTDPELAAQLQTEVGGKVVELRN